MAEEIPKLSLQNNRLFAIALTLITICLCGYLPFAILSSLFAPSNSQYVSPAPQALQTYFTLQTFFQWCGYLILPIVILILLGITYKRGDSANNTMTDGSWITLLITVGIVSTYFWTMFLLYSRLFGYIEGTGSESALLFFLVGCGCLPLAFIFPLLALVLAMRSRRKSTWWWLGLILAFGLLPIILFARFINP